MEIDIDSIQKELKDIQVLIRVNNLLLSRFIVEMSKTRKELGLPKRMFAFKFEILEDEYNLLIKEFNKDEVDKALYRLDRLLLTNKQQCPNNIPKYIRNKLIKNKKSQEYKRRLKELRNNELDADNT